MLLEIDEDYKIKSDSHNYILIKKYEVKNKETEEVTIEWKPSNITPYHNTVSGALKAYVEIRKKESKKKTFPAFIKEVEKLEERMAKLLGMTSIEPLSRTGR